jgi:monoterpene epsilon-lactone hydrolase
MKSRSLRRRVSGGDAIWGFGSNRLAEDRLFALTLTVLVSFGSCSFAQAASVDAEGTAHVAGFDMPFSDLASAGAQASFIEWQKRPLALFNLPPTTPIAEMRRLMDEQYFNPLAAKQRAAFQVTIENEKIAGIETQVFLPEEGVSKENAHRIMINVHGGAFMMGARTETLVEAIPLAATMRIKIVSPDYRMGPEHHFPAASEDIAAVYRELLKTYKPSEIAIFGCSGGGVITGEAMAWFQKVGLPNPSAIGIFCAHTQSRMGDSGYTAPRFGSVTSGIPPTPPKWPRPADAYYDFPKGLAYFEGADHNDPLVCPSASQAVIAKFPPTLLIVGSRDVMASGAARTQIELAMDHNFMSDPDLPESKEAYQLMAAFFKEEFEKAKTRH